MSHTVQGQILLLVIGITVVAAAHFRGGTMSWRPTGNLNEVEVSYRMGFNGFRGPDERPPGGHYRCSEEAKHGGWVLGTTGYLECEGCEGFTWKDMEWRCTDFDPQGGWDIGGDSLIVKVPNERATVYFNQCCWIGPLVNAPKYHTNQGYKMMTEIDLRPRPDTGRINSSPITEHIPVQLLHSGCKYWFEIPVTDPDNDAYRCRYTKGWEDECYDNQGQGSKHADICWELSYITVHENCTLEFDTSGGAGHYAVRLMIEDLLVDQNGEVVQPIEPLSKVSLSFLLQVAPDDSTCKGPRIITPSPGSCKTITVGELYRDTVVAEAATDLLYIQRIETSKPHGMAVSELYDANVNPLANAVSLEKAVDISWIPTADQVGRHSLGFNAVDKDGFSSGWSFISLNVVGTGHNLHPIASESNPSEGQEIGSTNGWTVRFNRPITRPTQPAYITLYDSQGNIADRLDASQEQHVSFSDQEITFSVLLGSDVWGKQIYTLRLDGGVAIDAEVAECSTYSSPDTWDVVVIGAEKPATKAPTTKVPIIPTRAPTQPPTLPPTLAPTSPPKEPIYKCTSGDMDIDSPPGVKEGDECFIHLEDSSFTVNSQNSVNVPYKLCCPGTCKQTGPPSPPGPPGTDDDC
ncbi:uncharacterized protein [Amphiura filiformis]|uniref:uncharacterized protein n=1 Tax=Amphiura filiformis TaxID=82378 RepID=UPI003B2142E5